MRARTARSRATPTTQEEAHFVATFQALASASTARTASIAAAVEGEHGVFAEYAARLVAHVGKRASPKQGSFLTTRSRLRLGMAGIRIGQALLPPPVVLLSCVVAALTF